jgi:hypothetical protein
MEDWLWRMALEDWSLEAVVTFDQIVNAVDRATIYW